MKNRAFFLGRIIFVFLILLSLYPSQGYALKFVAGKGGAISPTGPEPVPSSSIFFLGMVQVLPSAPDDIIIGMAKFPLTPTAVPFRILRVANDGSLFDATGSAITGEYPRGVHPRHIIAVEGKTEGLKDIFVGCHGYDASPFPGEPNIYLENSGGGKLVNRSAALPQGNDFTHSVAAGDIDGDGRVDLYAGNVWGQQQVGPYFLMGNAAGGFDLNTARLPWELTSLNRVFASSALVDMDNDGHLDLVLGSDSGDPSWVLLNDGLGNFSFSRAIQLPPALFGDANSITVFVLPVDLNGDGYKDLLLSQTKYSPFYTGGGIQVLINNHGIGFTDETASRMPAGTVSDTNHWIPLLTAADLNLDGAPDLIASQCWTKETQPFLWLNDGTGHFTGYNASQLQMGETLPNDVYYVALTDINRDGVPDLIFLYTIWDPKTLSSSGRLAYQSMLNVQVIPVTAGFTASTTSGNAPLKVNFTDKSTGTINKWLWKFGDGKTSAKQNPSQTYKKAGIYTVELTVTGSDGATSTKTQTNYITVYAPPKAKFTASPKNGKAPLTVNFTDQSTGDITGRLWTFGDGQTSTEQNPAHTYSQAGKYPITLTITGPVTTSTKIMTVNVK